MKRESCEAVRPGSFVQILPLPAFCVLGQVTVLPVSCFVKVQPLSLDAD